MPNRDYGIHSRTDEGQERPQAVAVSPPAKLVKTRGDKKREDEVDEAEKESFPASDAPSSWAGPDLPPKQRAEKAAREQAARRKRHA